LTEPLRPGNARLKELRRLVRDADMRRSHGVAVLEGPRLLEAALAADAAVQAVFVEVDRRAGVTPLLDAATARGASRVLVASGALDSIGDVRASQGVIAVVARPAAPSRAALAASTFVLVAHEIADPGNAGALVRSAAAFSADAIVLGPGSVDAYNPKTLRASAGAAFTVPILEANVQAANVQGTTTARLLDDLQGLQRLGAAPHGTPAPEIDLTVPVAIVLGHETRGLPADLPLDGHVAVPIAHEVESLNVAMAGTVLAYEVSRQRIAAQHDEPVVKPS
jgi:TrmH family RNA methyltransferase